MRRYLFLFVLGPAVCVGQVSAVRFLNRDAWRVEGPRLRVTILQSGGHVGEITLREPGAANPLWIQARPTIEPDQFDPARHEKIYGSGVEARLMSGLAGHNLCFPFWGNPSPAEGRAGMTFHGEAGITRWKQNSANDGALTVSGEFPESRTRFVRTVRVRGQIAYFDETAENLSAWDRPVGWCEHVTMGPPFLERKVTLIDASLTRGRLNSKEFIWPEGMAGQPVDLRQIGQQGGILVNNFQVDPKRTYGFFSAVNPKLGLLFGYVFRRSDFPWLNIWEANTPEMLTRGMEFSNTPTHGTMKALAATPALFGTPAYEWLDAKSKIRKRFASFSVKVPDAFRVSDVRISGKRLELVASQTVKVIALDFEPGLL
jgi:hypothetical protein